MAMADAPADRLYNTDILRLAVTLAEYPLDRVFEVMGEAHSRSCGSHLSIGLDVDNTDRIAKLGLRVNACAIGQAAATLFARHAIGRGMTDITTACRQVETWLRERGELPDWPGLAILAPARDYPARHDAALLPWKAASAALSKPQASG